MAANLSLELYEITDDDKYIYRLEYLDKIFYIELDCYFEDLPYKERHQMLRTWMWNEPFKQERLIHKQVKGS